MLYYSTTNQSQRVSFRNAMIQSEAADGGLYMPDKLPVLPQAFLNNISVMNLNDISFVINSMLMDKDVAPAVLKNICDTASAYPMPLRQIEPGVFVLEAFHGPTQNVKDYGACFAANLLEEIHGDNDNPLNVLIATNGHAGCAIAHEFHDVPGVNVFILYPKGLHRNYYETITSMGDNIHAIEVAGSIHNCRSLVTKAFEDQELNETMTLTSANSTNIGFLLPVTSLYFHAYAQLMAQNGAHGDLYMSIPTGHGGNLLAAYISKRMGLPVTRLIAACSASGGFSRHINGNAHKGAARRTMAWGMDSPVVANLPRFAALSGGDISRLRDDITAATVSDDDIALTINDVYERTGYLLDPHSAVAYKALRDNMPRGGTGILLATGHPARSTDILHKVNRGHLRIPFHIDRPYCSRPEATIAPTYMAFKKLLKYHAIDKRMQGIG